MWIVGVLGWSLVRIAAVDIWLSGYGVNPWVYAAIDLGTSIPYAIASARTIGALLDSRTTAALRWGALAVGAYIAPDLYILFFGRGLPWKVYAAVGTVALAGAYLAVRTGRQRVRAAHDAAVHAPFTA